MTLPPAFLERPLAHRGLHDVAAGRPENSRAAVRAALERGYGIEIDLQLSKDGQAMVFHDYDLARLTGVSGPVSQRTASELNAIRLLHGDEGIPTLRDILDIVAGLTPVLIELKDQDGAMGPNVGVLEAAVAQELAGYNGPVALMSFNPYSVAALANVAPKRSRGLTTAGYEAVNWPGLPASVRDRLRDIPDFDRVGAGFISHDARDLASPAVAAIQQRGMPVLCWTVRSPEAEAEARKLADNVTFEGYPA